jgi:cell volume regulation protein A
MIDTASILVLAGVLLLAGVLSSKISSKINLPILFVFLAVGMIAGNDGLSLVNINSNDNGSTVNFFGTVAMCFILFSGGVGTSYSAIRKVILPGSMLATIGVVLTAVILGSAVYLFSRGSSYAMPLSWCLLLGALISSTDAAAVFGILRGNRVSLKGGKLQSLLELESGSNDPAAYLLTTIVLTIIKQPEDSSLVYFAAKIILGVVWGIGIGVLLGLVFGVGFQYICTLCGKRKLIEYEGLYFVVAIAVVLLTYGITEEYFKANGLMAVYVCGITMGNIRFYFKKGITQFSDGVAWLMQVGLFTTLGLLG